MHPHLINDTRNMSTDALQQAGGGVTSPGLAGLPGYEGVFTSPGQLPGDMASRIWRVQANGGLRQVRGDEKSLLPLGEYTMPPAPAPVQATAPPMPASPQQQAPSLFRRLLGLS